MTASFNRSHSCIIPREQVSKVERVEIGTFQAGSRADGRPGGPNSGSAQTRAAFAAALEQGYREGLASGQAAAAAEADAARARVDAVVERLEALCGRVAAAVAPLDAATARAAVDLACTMARQIVRHELALRPEMILAVIEEARAALPAERRQVRVLVHPDDAALVEAHAHVGGDEHSPWRVIPDPTVERGGCRIEASSGDVDATLATRWAGLYESLGLAPHKQDKTALHAANDAFEPGDAGTGTAATVGTVGTGAAPAAHGAVA